MIYALEPAVMVAPGQTRHVDGRITLLLVYSGGSLLAYIPSALRMYPSSFMHVRFYLRRNAKHCTASSDLR